MLLHIVVIVLDIVVMAAVNDAVQLGIVRHFLQSLAPRHRKGQARVVLLGAGGETFTSGRLVYFACMEVQVVGKFLSVRVHDLDGQRYIAHAFAAPSLRVRSSIWSCTIMSAAIRRVAPVTLAE